MWVPRNAQEIEDAARGGRLIETPSFDAKADLPAAKKNIDVAKDVAAMGTDGGVLLYGVGEDENGNPTRPGPLALAGTADRVSQIVSTSIAEVPFIELREIPCADQESRGYLAVVVPQSARAPHMVIVNGDNRYYGRDAKGNRILTEGDVARLYERRQRWEIDREQVLIEVIKGAPLYPSATQGYIYAFTRPAAVDEGIFERAQATIGQQQVELMRWLMATVNSTELQGAYGPSLGHSPYLRRHGADMWRWATRSVEDIDPNGSDPTSLVTLDVNLDGRGQLFCGRATDTRVRDPDRPPRVIEIVIAGNVEAFFTVMGAIYEAAGYHGAVDVGVAITGVKGAESERANRNYARFDLARYPVDQYRRTDRVAAAELRAAPALSQRLLRHFFEATTEIDGWNPWTQPKNR